jgi:hypothetical protein
MTERGAGSGVRSTERGKPPRGPPAHNRGNTRFRFELKPWKVDAVVAKCAATKERFHVERTDHCNPIRYT